MATESNDVTGDGDIESLIHGQREVENYSDKIYNWIAMEFQPLYNRIFSQRNQFTSKVSRKLKKSGKSEPVEVYLSAYMGMGIISGLIIGLFLSIYLFGSYNRLLVPTSLTTVSSWFPEYIIANILFHLSWILSSLTITMLSTASVAAGMVYVAVQAPNRNIKSRQQEIDVLLPDAIAFMYCLSTSGMSRIDIMRELASSEEIYGEVSVEFQRIVLRIDTFSEDYNSAINEVNEITPSNELSTFLNDMLSTVSAGGDMSSFLETQLNLFLSNVERTQQEELDSLELFSEGYITLSLIPVITIIIVSFAGAMGAPQSILLMSSYVGVTIIQLGSLSIITTVFQNEYGDGKLVQDANDNFEFVNDKRGNVLSAGVAKKYQGESKLFDQIYANEIRTRIFNFMDDPLQFVRVRPEYSFIIMVPTAIAFVGMAFATGNIELSVDAFLNNGFKQTFLLFYAPVMIALAPYVYFYEIDLYKRGTITDGLTEDLNKLANTNQQGITLQESLRITSQDSDTMLSEEFQEMYKKQQLKIPLGKTIIETNNKYRIPRLARIFRIIKSAQDVSDNINEVLDTASNLAEIQHNIIMERKAQTKQQVGIVAIIFFIFIVGLVLMNGYIVPTASEMPVNNIVFEGDPIPLDTIEVISFHGALIQAVIAGAISGYIRTGEYQPGIKYSLIYATITMIVWGIL